MSFTWVIPPTYSNMFSNGIDLKVLCVDAIMLSEKNDI